MDTDRITLRDLIARLEDLPPDTACTLERWDWADGSGGGVNVRLTFHRGHLGPMAAASTAGDDFIALAEIGPGPEPLAIIEMRHSARQREAIQGTIDAGFVEFDAADFPPGEARHIRVTEGGLTTTFLATGEPAGAGRTRFRLDSPVEVRRAGS